MAKDSNEKIVRSVLEESGATVLSISRKNHLKIRWRYRGEERTTVTASTVSDKRGMKNIRAWVKRQLREIDDE